MGGPRVGRAPWLGPESAGRDPQHEFRDVLEQRHLQSMPWCHGRRPRSSGLLWRIRLRSDDQGPGACSGRSALYKAAVELANGRLGLAAVFPDELTRCRSQGLLGPIRIHRQAKSMSSTVAYARTLHSRYGTTTVACS